MTWSTNARRTALTLALCAVFTTAGAKSFDQTGPAPASLTPLPSYGVDVATKTALRSVVPAGWQLFVHRGTTLPTAMSWRAGTTWPTALAEFVDGTDISVLVDWDRKAVYFRPVTVALEDATKRAMVSQAATTPLPSLRGEGASAKIIPPDLAQNAVPPAPAVDPSVVSSLQAKLHTLEAQLSAAQTAKQAGDQDIANRVGALEVALKEKGETLQQAQAELAAARESARQAEQAAEELKAQQAIARVELESRLQALAARPVATEVGNPVALPPVTAQARVTAAPVLLAPVSVVTPAAALALQTQVSPEAGASAAARPDVVASTAPADIDQYISLSASKSFNRASVREVAQYVAEVHGLHLVTTGAEAVFRGPVTVFGGDAAEDIRLMHKALGNAAGVSFELFRPERVLKVDASRSGLKTYARVSETAYSGPLPAVVTKLPVAPAMEATASEVRPSLSQPRIAAAPVVAIAQAPVVAEPPAVVVPSVAAIASAPSVHASAPDAVASVVPPATVAVTSAAAATVAPLTKLRLEIAVGEDLQAAVTAFLREQGFETRWQVEELFEASSVFVGQGDSVIEVLTLLLPKLGLSADVQSDAKRVTVRSADPVRDAK